MQSTHWKHTHFKKENFVLEISARARFCFSNTDTLELVESNWRSVNTRKLSDSCNRLDVNDFCC